MFGRLTPLFSMLSFAIGSASIVWVLASGEAHSQLRVSSHPCARITVDGSPCGETPLVLSLDSGQAHTIRFDCDGRPSATFTVEPRVRWGRLAACFVGGPVLGVLQAGVGYATGHCFELDEEALSVDW